MQVKNNRYYTDTQAIGLSQVSSQKESESSYVPEQTGAASMMNYLTQKYKNIDFSFISFDNNRQISQYGATQRGTNNVAISEKLLERMSTDDKLRQQIEDILDHMSSYQSSAKIEAFLCDKDLVGMGLVIDEDGQVSKWTAMKEKEKESYPTWWRDKESTSFYANAKKKTPKTRSYSFSHTSNMMRLASARDVKSVKGLISAKYGEMLRVKSQVSDPAEAAAVIRKIKSVIQSGNIKVARLHKEENLRLRQKSAERKMKEKLARQLAQELKRKQNSRMGQERCQTAGLDDVLGAPVSDERFRQIAEQYVDTLSSTALAAEMPSLGAAAAGSGVSVEVMSAPVTSVASIDCSA